VSKPERWRTRPSQSGLRASTTTSGLMTEVLVYHDDEAIYFEHKGKDSGIVRFTFEMIEGLKIVEEESENSHQ
jgi:hypothetical protein